MGKGPKYCSSNVAFARIFQSTNVRHDQVRCLKKRGGYFFYPWLCDDLLVSRRCVETPFFQSMAQIFAGGVEGVGKGIMPFQNDKHQFVPNWNAWQTTILILIKMKENLPKGGKYCGTRRNCSLCAISPVFKRIVLQTRKTKACLGKWVMPITPWKQTVSTRNNSGYITGNWCGCLGWTDERSVLVSMVSPDKDNRPSVPYIRGARS